MAPLCRWRRASAHGRRPSYDQAELALAFEPRQVAPDVGERAFWRVPAVRDPPVKYRRRRCARELD
jgi:hypothetical protein